MFIVIQTARVARAQCCDSSHNSRGSPSRSDGGGGGGGGGWSLQWVLCSVQRDSSVMDGGLSDTPAGRPCGYHATLRVTTERAAGPADEAMVWERLTAAGCGALPPAECAPHRIARCA